MSSPRGSTVDERRSDLPPIPAGRKLYAGVMILLVLMAGEAALRVRAWIRYGSPATGVRDPMLQYDLQAAYPGVTIQVVNASLGVLPLDRDLVIYYEANNEIVHDTRELAARQGLAVDARQSPVVTLLSNYSLMFDLAYKISQSSPEDVPRRHRGSTGFRPMCPITSSACSTTCEKTWRRRACRWYSRRSS